MTCTTGVGSSLLANSAAANAFTKFRSDESWKIKRISGGGRSVAVIDDTDLGIAAGRPKQYCFGDLHELEPYTIECKLDVGNTTLFDAITDSGTEVIDIPVGLGPNPADNAIAEFLLTFPSITNAQVGTSPATLLFSGAIIRDSGFEYIEDDRPRITITVQPDGKKMTWTAVDATP